MSSSLSFQSLSPSDFDAVHKACEVFEQGFRCNEPVSIEQQLIEAPAEIRNVLLVELLTIELEWRRSRHEVPQLADYLNRFPGSRETIERLIEEAANQESLQFQEASPNPISLKELQVPQNIGRYIVSSVIGMGAFGLVYRAIDPSLDRVVAIKVPRPELVANRQNIEAYLTEARTLASLSHPNIIPVHDVGSNSDFPCFMVLDFIEGETLAARLEKGRFSAVNAAELVATIAETLHYVHNHGLTHRDVKPANIYIESNGRPYLIDFGLALLDDDLGRGPKYAGTVAYMSPEQARGEGHRVDGRSDIFSLGAILYELLSRHRPFRGSSKVELMHQVANLDPRPLRQYDETIPHALVQICAKAMSKRALDRYSSAYDLALDLRGFIAQSKSVADSSGLSNSLTKASDSGSSYSERQLVRIVPKGLRSFDGQDADFFVSLLPGVRDSNGLPDSLRFWKSKIEQNDADLTFAVGLLYGPSGCGKSSLVKAGLLPRLATKVISIYVEATASETSTVILRRLQRQFAELPRDLDLYQTLKALRTGSYLRSSEKVLIVIDQFEQWLHANLGQENTELVQALRQCDGGKVQCLVMVRDDFWMATTRFMHELDCSLLDGINSRSIDIFSLRHAKRVLTAFGQAFGAIPQNVEEISPLQNEFLEKAVGLLAEDGTVVCVRLALFAQLMSDREWSLETLQSTGGTTSLGTEFLETTFASPKSPPAHRYHQTAARAVLQLLLPDLGTEIKGNMQSYDSLLAASGYSRREDFDKLLQILDLELRLITPAESTDQRFTVETQLNGSTLENKVRYYQLTHDYLVPALRCWLFQKQQETRRGRAELLLADRSALWKRKQEADLLPKLWDFLTIKLWTDPKKWTATQVSMMRLASRRLSIQYGFLLATTVLVFAVIQVALYFQTQRNLVSRAETAVAAVQLARSQVVPLAIRDLQVLPKSIVLAELRDRFLTANDDHYKLALAFALAHFDVVESEFMISMVSDSTSTEAANFHSALKRDKERSLMEIHKAIASMDTYQQPRRASQLAIVALQLGDATYFRAFCENPTDPNIQSLIIDELPRWHGDLAELSKMASFEEPFCRASIACGIGSLPADQLTSDEVYAWSSIFKDWYLSEHDCVTHSAAGWALRQWNFELPPLVKNDNVGESNWQVNSLQMTMCKIPAGSFMRQDTLYGGESNQVVTLTRDFLLCDLEVSVEQFHQFISDENYDASRKPSAWEGEDKAICSTEKHPIQNVSWYDAVLFCNWLSHREGLKACYERTGREDNTERRGLEEWDLVEGSNGYRLPTEAEWELACRAGTSTKYHFGDNEALLERHAVFSTSRPLVCGQKLPNRLGLFDCIGNAYEWCHDWSSPYKSPSVVDPSNENAVGMRAMRGGTYFNPSENCESSHRNRSGPWGRSNFCGFRIARSVP